MRRTPWDQPLTRRLAFERGAHAAHPSLTSPLRPRGDILYDVDVQIDVYEPRHLQILVARGTPKPSLRAVYADGPTDSPHRYKPRAKDRNQRPALCIWTPGDPPDERWLPDDGLLSLIEHARVHLFKEAYWREHGEWLGEETFH